MDKSLEKRVESADYHGMPLSEGRVGMNKIRRILSENYVRPDQSEYVKSKIKENGQYTIIDKIKTCSNSKQAHPFIDAPVSFVFAFPMVWRNSFHRYHERTYVFVNDPTMGYGLFIEWMLAQETP